MPNFTEYLTTFQLNDGVDISVSIFLPESPKRVLLHTHGNAINKEFYTSYARFLANSGVVCYLVDFRGSGKSGGRKGRVEYTGQLEMDLIQLVEYIKSEYPILPFYLSGHSGGTVINSKVLADYNVFGVDGLICFAPIYPQNFRSNPNILLGTLNSLLPVFMRIFSNKLIQTLPRMNYFKLFLASYFPIFRHAYVLTFPKNMNQEFDFKFSYLTVKSYAFKNPNKFLRRLSVPVFYAIGSDDEVTKYEYSEDVFNQILHSNPASCMKVVEGANHFNILRKAKKHALIWMNELDEKQGEKYV
ncbi:MAG: alpha/beta hydrolase [Gammaproteobacteria bacterium]|nr:alpha/beta hydrolase [Gammaproteobacteria bacterium]